MKQWYIHGFHGGEKEIKKMFDDWLFLANIRPFILLMDLICLLVRINSVEKEYDAGTQIVV